MTESIAAVTVFDPHALTGLSQAEAHRRLRQDGPNELPRRESRGLLYTVIQVLREPMILLKPACAGDS